MISSFAMPLIGAEAVAASALAFLATAITSAYLADWIGLAIRPLPILVCPPAPRRRRSSGCGGLAARDTASLARASAAASPARSRGCCGARAPIFCRPAAAPTSRIISSLLEYIQRHWRLPHDVSLYEYLGEMVDYTPGSHLLAVLAGAWFGSDALHAVYPVVAGTVALKAGFVFLIARGVLPRRRAACAVRGDRGRAAVPRARAFRRLVHGAVVSRAGRLGAVCRRDVVGARRLGRAAVAGRGCVCSPSPASATFLSWPVWVGPVMVVLAGRAPARRAAAADAAPAAHDRAAVPIGIVAAIHGSRHAGGFRMAGTGGFAIWPTPAAARLVVSSASPPRGCFSAGHPPRARGDRCSPAPLPCRPRRSSVPRRSSGAAAPYLSLKMFYLAVYPLMIGAR